MRLGRRLPALINLYSEHLITQPVQVSEGVHKVPDAPGLGVEVDEDAV